MQKKYKMNKNVQDILELSCNRDQRKEMLDAFLKDIEDDVELAKNVLDGTYKYCPQCDDYYMTKSFIPEELCGAKYLICPKGHSLGGRNEHEN